MDNTERSLHQVTRTVMSSLIANNETSELFSPLNQLKKPQTSSVLEITASLEQTITANCFQIP